MRLSAGMAPAIDPVVEKRPFIRATEVWVPSEDGTRLVLQEGLYGALDEFERVAKETTFGPDEGLPGKAWACGRPIVLKDLVGSYFKRGAAAEAAGLTCAVAIPVFADTLKAVLVMFCGEDREHVGAIEVWHAPADSYEMGLVDGYYGSAQVFEWTARHMNFVKGSGLPGQTWESGAPVVFADLRAPRFLRWEKAEAVGITRGVGIPVHTPHPGTYVFTLLSALSTPIARRVEVWSAAGDGSLALADGFCERAGLLGAAPLSLKPGEGAIGRAAATGVPATSDELAHEPEAIATAALAAGLSTLIALPVHDDAGIAAVAVWYL